MDTFKVKVIRLSPSDNVVVALGVLETGAKVDSEGIACVDVIPSGHKVATTSIPKGSFVRKYGQVIGIASKPIRPGEHVHTHNMSMTDLSREYTIGDKGKPAHKVKDEGRALFEGIVRNDGRVATRNYIGVLPSVGCSATVCRYIADAFRGEVMDTYPNVDGVVGLTQTSGCGIAPYGEGYENLQRSLAGYAHHPNFWGILFVGLGCEVNQINQLLEATGLERSSQLKTITIQDAGGTEPALKQGIEIIKEMLPEANLSKRKPVPASHLIVGLECGGSDAYSGITANPALGAAVDLLVYNGGAAVLSETTEIYGAEHLLVRRAIDSDVGHRLIQSIHWWEEYTARNGANIDNNPSPGNKAGGLTTILEKSLGAVAKGGSTSLMEVYRYAEPIKSRGLVFMDTPGFDLASVTGMIAGGANIICFTTGCGTVLGCKPTPVIKLASNTPMYQRLSADMDINCGVIADGESSVEEMGKVIFQRILETASGKKTKSELFDYGDNEFVPWQIGAIV